MTILFKQFFFPGNLTGFEGKLHKSMMTKRNGDILGSGELSCDRQIGHPSAKSCLVYLPMVTYI